MPKGYRLLCILNINQIKISRALSCQGNPGNLMNLTYFQGPGNSENFDKSSKLLKVMDKVIFPNAYLPF